MVAPSHINLGSKLPFMEHLKLPDLAQLTNDPICHQTFWPPMPTKLPSYIPKFEGKPRECPQNHIMMFHLWCSSNSIVDDLIRLRLFQRTLTGAPAKWYIELLQAKYPDFNSLAFMFQQYFQLPIRHDEGVEILLSFRQNTAIHITDHIYEWRQRRSLYSIQLYDKIFLDWFLNTLLSPIAKDIAHESR